MAGTPRQLASRTSAVQDADHLVAGLRARDSTAWAEVFNAYYPGLVRYIAARLGSAEQAEDLCSTVFLRALIRIDSYKPRGKPIIAWLYGITQNVIREARREARKNSAVTADAPPAQLDLVPDPRDDSTLLMSILDLRAALAALTDAQQEVINLRFIGGFSARQVACMTARTTRSVYYLEARGLLRLRDELGDAGPVVQR